MKQYMNRAIMANPPSGIRRIGQMARSIPGCIALTIGEPDFDAPKPIREKIAQAIAGGETHYPPNAGYPSLLRDISSYINGLYGTDYLPEETICTVGSTQALASTLFAILNPGDEVIVPVPAFGLYKTQIEMAGAVYVPMQTKEDGFQITRENLAAHLTERTRAIVYASPNNPNGVILNEKSLAVLREAALERDLFLVSDCAYDRLVYDGKLPTLMGDAALRDRLIYIGALSKTFAMTGVRVGFLAADMPVLEEIRKVHAMLVVSVPGCIQRGCEGMLDTPIDDMIAAYKARRDYVVARLNAMGLCVDAPGGAFYVFPSIEKTGMTDDEFCDRLMHEGKLALIPASCFGSTGHVRISYCYEMEALAEGMDRLERFLKECCR